MRRIVFLLTVSALTALVYVKFLRITPDAEPDTAPAEVISVTQISKLLEGHSKKTFGDGLRPADIPELRALRASLAQRKQAAPERESAAWDAAVQICDTLLLAIQEVGQQGLKSKATSSLPYASMGDKQEESRKFFEEGRKRRLFEKRVAYERRIKGLLDKIREYERQ